MSQFEKSSHKIVSLLRRTPAFEGTVVHRSEHGIVHEQVRRDGKADPPVLFVRAKSRGERIQQDQGILEKTEIEDLGKVYQELKTNLNIKPTEKLQSNLDLAANDDNDSPAAMSTSLNTSKIRELYFKKREEKKMKKLNNSIERYVKSRNQSLYNSAPSTPGVNNKILNFVRTKNRLSYESNNQSKYREEMTRCIEETTHARAGNHLRVADNHIEGSYQRQNIISLETGLPVKPYIQLNSFRQRIEQREQLFDPNKKPELKGVNRKKSKTYSVHLPSGQNRSFTPNGTSIVTSLDEYFQLFEEDQRKLTKRKPTQWIPKGESPTSHHHSLHDKYNQLREKVENNEISLVDCCENFLRTKQRKNNQFINLIQTANRDRPMTQQIRLRLYTSSQNERQRLSQLRRSAERQRQQLMTGNTKQHKWYEQLVEQISRVRDEHESLATCDYLFDSLKNLLEDGRIIGRGDIMGLLGHIDSAEELLINNIAMFLIKKIGEDFGIAIDELRQFHKVLRFLTVLQRERAQEKERLLA